jgi:hypothetical protein
MQVAPKFNTKVPRFLRKAIGYDSSSDPPGFLLGTSWTVRSAMLMYREGEKKGKKLQYKY